MDTERDVQYVREHLTSPQDIQISDLKPGMRIGMFGSSLRSPAIGQHGYDVVTAALKRSTLGVQTDFVQLRDYQYIDIDL